MGVCGVVVAWVLVWACMEAPAMSVTVPMNLRTADASFVAALGQAQTKGALVSPRSSGPAPTCKYPDGRPGRCVLMEECEELFPMVHDLRNPRVVSFLMERACSMTNSAILMCCPTTSPGPFNQGGLRSTDPFVQPASKTFQIGSNNPEEQPALPNFSEMQPALSNFSESQPALPNFSESQPTLPNFSESQPALPNFSESQPALPNSFELQPAQQNFSESQPVGPNIPAPQPNRPNFSTAQPTRPNFPTAQPTQTNLPTAQPARPNFPTAQPTRPNFPTAQPTRPIFPTAQPTRPNFPTAQPTRPIFPSPQPTQPNFPSSQPTLPNFPPPQPTQPNFPPPQPTQPNFPPPQPTQPAPSKRPVSTPSFEDECGYLTSQPNQITQGVATQYPWHAAVGWRNGSEFSVTCSGALVSQQHVVVAAHCMMSPRQAKSTHVRLGQPGSDKVIELSIAGFKDAGFDRAKQIRDIGLVLLEEPVALDDHVRPVCLPLRYEYDGFRYQKVNVVGWHGIGDEAQASKALVVGLEPCRNFQEEITSLSLDSNDKMCAVMANDTQCQDDVGAIMTYHDDVITDRHFLIGLTSVSYHCTNPSWPTLYTRVGPLLQWLKENMAEQGERERER